MPIKRTCLAMGLACAATAAAPVLDENCLVQSQSVLTSRELALAPKAPSVLKDFSLKVPALVRDVAQQFPMMPSSVPGMGEMGGMGNMGNWSMEELMTWGMEVLSIFRNETIVAEMYANLHRMTAGLLNTSANIITDTNKLAAEAEKAGNKEEALAAVEKFMGAQTKALIGMLADVVVNTRSFLKLLPSNMTVVQQVQPMFGMIANLTKADIIDFIWAMAEPQLDQLFANTTSYCQVIEPAEANLTKLAASIKEMPAMLQAGRDFGPQISTMLESLAPDVAPVIGKYFNATLDQAEQVVAAFQESAPKGVDTLLKVSTEKVGCSFETPKSTAAPRRFGLFAVVAAAVAWLAVL